MAVEHDPSHSPRAYYGAELRRLREQAGLSQEALGQLVFCSGGYIGQMEVAVRKPQEDLSKRLDQVLKTDGHLLRVYEMVKRSSRYVDYFADVAELQSMARTISQSSPLLVPGLMQTPDYARALFESAQPLRKAADNEALVAARMARTELLEQSKAPQYWAVLDEAVLRRPVGGAAVMGAQMAHLGELIRSRKALIQVVPYSVGAHSLMVGPLCLMTFDDAPPVAYVEGPFTGNLVDDPALVGRCTLAYDLVRAAALPPEASLALIESAAKGYANAPSRAVA
ncbi:helix-turn-helix transcriptional regulator [Kitasatospora sp. A2-31]|uniref:helix-turn-helix domain-containing protein n=1 Tax=Kitasatospora sp. A2-31 TaxID=2916414 RepID=UPI001EEA0FEA|nr:helix-turn-helix transcriptional regulator [Kitasatospora sp. A2-31]MCG6497303.1 helix-turn-helix domain-containing protein [Kitasatospora sp. A2-31]